MSPKIKLFSFNLSPPAMTVQLTAKMLKIDLDIKEIDLFSGENFSEDYLKMNPSHAVPVIDDNGFILTESRAIIRYLCNRYAPDSPLYPKDAMRRAQVDEKLDFDNPLLSLIRTAIFFPYILGIPAADDIMNSFKDKMKVLDQIIGDKKYLVDKHLTIADISLLATTNILFLCGFDLSGFPNFKRWSTAMKTELPFHKEICDIDPKEFEAQVKRSKALLLNMKK